jgi:hypothetical protein
VYFANEEVGLLLIVKFVERASLGLKRKFSFLYFRANFAKFFVRLSRKNVTNSYENNERFRENKNLRKKGRIIENAVKHPNSKRQMKFRTNRSGQC